MTREAGSGEAGARREARAQREAHVRRESHARGHDAEHHAIYEATEYLDAPVDEVIPEREVSLAERLLNWRTIGSIVFAIVILVLLFRFAFNIDFARTWRLIAGANPALLLVAFVAYYLTFPLRGLRWRYVLSRSGMGLASATPRRSCSCRGS